MITMDHNNMLFCDSGKEDINGDTKIGIPKDELDRRYYEEKIATDLDRFLEEPVTGSLRMWHLIMMIAGVVGIAIISLCCVFRCRIPRTKTEIEANSRRKYLLKNFNAKLQQIKAADLDDMDYRNALEKLREEFKADSESLVHSEAISILSLCDE